MNLIFHGSAGEVGRSCIELSIPSSNGNQRFLLDAGFKVHDGNPELPLSVSNISEIDGVLITHSHMDHIGALPYFHHQGLLSPVFMTAMTKKLTRIMLTDSLHLELLRHHHPAYNDFDVSDVLNRVKEIKYYHLMKFGNLEFEYIPSGHIPGSSMILLKANNKTILYSGDINDEDTHLIHGMRTDFLKNHKIDVLICESTYGDREHKSRVSEQKRFLKSVKSTINNGGSILLPAFAIGRAQELIMLLDELDVKVPIYLDGMAKSVADTLISSDVHIRNHSILEKALSKVNYVNGKSKRHKILNKQCIIVTTSGMVSGGPVMEYIKHFWHSKESSIFLTGFQAQGTNGRLLRDSGKAMIDGHTVRFECNIDNFDFSGHAGLKGILKLIKKSKPDVLILNHGDPNALASLSKKVSEDKMVDQVIVPENGHTLTIE